MKSNGRNSHSAPSAGPPNAPGYTALRIAAEWASAVRGQPLYLAYDAVTGHVGVVNESAAELTLETSAGRRRPRVLEVEITVPTDRGDSTRLTLPGQQVSALFWGESAVEKFLVPYYASVAADDAAAFLSRLLTAWYGYPASVVQVCAIAYLCGAQPPEPGTRLSLGGTVGIIFVERAGGELRMLTLEEFTARYSLGMPRSAVQQPAPSPAVRMTGWEVTHGVENVVARDVAEFVSGLRGHVVTFTAEGSTLVPELQGPAVPEASGPGRFVMAAVAEHVRADRPYPRRIRMRVRPRGGKEHWHDVVKPDSHPVTTPDSMFWSDGAVEKLLLPYYASVKGRTAPYFIEALMGRWDGYIKTADTRPDVGASMRARLGADPYSPSPARAAADEDDTPVYTVTHLPRSEYATTTRGEALEGRMVLLSAEGEGTARYTLRGEAVGGKAPGQRSTAGAAAAGAKSSRKRTSRAT